MLIVIVIPSVAATIVVGIVAVMAGKTGRAVEGLGMALTAGSAAVIHSATALIGNTRVWTAIFRRPVIHRMAGGTVEPEQARMINRVTVTIGTGGGDFHELAAFMTALTGHPHMPAGQRKITEIMVEIGILPIGWVVAGGAVRAVLPLMFIVLPVTGVAIHRCVLVLPGDMAGFAGYFCMLAFEFESREIVVEPCGNPACLGMTICTGQTEPSLVWLIPVVAGVTILERHREVSQAARLEMTLVACQPGVLTLEFEGK